MTDYVLGSFYYAYFQKDFNSKNIMYTYFYKSELIRNQKNLKV